MQTILEDDGDRPSAEEYNYPKCNFTKRQANFYQNLLQIYQLTGSKTLPVYFQDGNGNKLRMDRGCVAMAAHDGFILPLENDKNGILSEVTLNW
jgi:hypothetical protein